MKPKVRKGCKKTKGLRGLSDLYDRIHKCKICPDMYRVKRKARRREDAVSKDMDVLIISQALARETMFESGVNFIKTDGTPGDTGKNLEKLLNKFGRTIYPRKKIKLKNGCVRPCFEGLIPVYNTEVVQCFPGKAKTNGKDRKPTAEEIKKCYQKGFLLNEIKILKPRLIILMGRVSRDTFFKYYLNRHDYPKKLTDHIADIILKKKIPKISVRGEGKPVHVLPIQHASGVNRQLFNKMLENAAIIKMIRRFLNEQG